MGNDVRIKKSIVDALAGTYDPVTDLPEQQQKAIYDASATEKPRLIDNSLDQQPMYDKLKRLLKTAYYGSTR